MTTCAGWQPARRRRHRSARRTSRSRRWIPQPGKAAIEVRRAIPSEVELATRFRVRQCASVIDELVAETPLLRRQGKGTFVATHSERQVQYRFLRLAKPDSSATSGLARGPRPAFKILRSPPPVRQR